MKDLYVKTESGEFVPISIEKVFSNPSEWDNALILVRFGDENYAASQDDLDELFDTISGCDVVQDINNASFLVTGPPIVMKKIGILEEK